MKLSLILATRNNAIFLDKMLCQLQSCQKPRDWEIIVVDNGSTDSTADICNKYSTILPIRYFFCNDRGKSRALNVGTAQAAGEILLFTDDDIIPDAAWLINHVNVLKNHKEITVVGGRIKLDRTVLPAWLTDSYNLAGILVSEHDLGDSEIIYPAGRYPFGPNMSVRRSVLINIDNPWPEHLGPGTRLPVGDEMWFVDRVSKPHERLYSPACLVEHRPVLAENFFAKAIKRCFQGGYAAGYYAKSVPTPKIENTAKKLANDRIRSCRSVQEFFCIVSRSVGYYSGQLLKRFH